MQLWIVSSRHSPVISLTSAHTLKGTDTGHYFEEFDTFTIVVLNGYFIQNVIEGPINLFSVSVVPMTPVFRYWSVIVCLL